MASTLKILLEPPYQRTDFKAHLFIPGDTVSGQVVLDLKDDETMNSICIELKGKYRIESCPGPDVGFYKLDLFSQRKTLFQGPFKLKASTYKYPFSFQFPERFDYERNNFIEDTHFPGQTRLGPHPLPPTCEDDDIKSGKCSIYYTLSVKIPRSIGSWEDKVSLNFTPCRSEPSPTPLLEIAKDYATLHQQFRLTNEGIPRPLTSREIMREAFHHHAETHTVNFSLSALAPTAIVIGKPYEIEVILVCKNTEELAGIPGFRIKDYSLFLNTRTDVRAPGGIYGAGCLLGDIPLSSGNLDLPLSINQPVQLNEMFPSNSYYAPPSFTSVAAKRSYGLELKAKVACIGKDFKCNFHWPNVTLYPSRMEDEMRDATRSIEAGTANLSLVSQERLPGYGDVARMPLPAYESVPTQNI